jgi:hypothetical protein
MKDTSGHKYINEYHIIKTIGEGAFGKVKLAVSKKTG